MLSWPLRKWSLTVLKHALLATEKEFIRDRVPVCIGLVVPALEKNSDRVRKVN